MGNILLLKSHLILKVLFQQRFHDYSLLKSQDLFYHWM